MAKATIECAKGLKNWMFIHINHITRLFVHFLDYFDLGSIELGKGWKIWDISFLSVLHFLLLQDQLIIKGEWFSSVG